MATTWTTSTSISRKPPTTAHGAVPRIKQRKVEGIYYLFLLPSLILFTLAITLPAIIGIFFSFTNSIGFGDWEFVGFINYIAAVQRPGDPAELPLHLRVRRRHGGRR